LVGAQIIGRNSRKNGKENGTLHTKFNRSRIKL